ncbi:HET-domain-containing protein [Xylariomycetidae sp. FL0641]|nr:HET-domain-containing protein [Xylariomycetidae sp. FL0641]
MRLLHTTTLILENFSNPGDFRGGSVDDYTKCTNALNPEGVEYAILSHTWTDSEVLFEDLYKASTSDWQSLPGAAKVLDSASMAKKLGYDYIWIDTCCIDKNSSAELSEAINSMFKWYQHSAVCLVYLSDVQEQDVQSFRKSRWFTRGWTLQELIAPSQMQIYDSDWRYIGDRMEMGDPIADVTGIDSGLLREGERLATRATLLRHELRRFPVSVKMCWASRRRTTRVEDVAYSLMGIFDVNMPLLYGEGAKAFRRLQEQIIHKTNDQSVLLHNDHVGALASSPYCFFGAFRFQPFARSLIKPPSMNVQADVLEITLLVCQLPIEAQGPPGTIRGIQNIPRPWRDVGDDNRPMLLAVLDIDVGGGAPLASSPVLELVGTAPDGAYFLEGDRFGLVRPTSDGRSMLYVKFDGNTGRVSSETQLNLDFFHQRLVRFHLDNSVGLAHVHDVATPILLELATTDNAFTYKLGEPSWTETTTYSDWLDYGRTSIFFTHLAFECRPLDQPLIHVFVLQYQGKYNVHIIEGKNCHRQAQKTGQNPLYQGPGN